MGTASPDICHGYVLAGWQPIPSVSSTYGDQLFSGAFVRASSAPKPTQVLDSDLLLPRNGHKEHIFSVPGLLGPAIDRER